MATFREDLRDVVERKTGIVGQVLRERREKQENNQQIERQVARVEQTTQAIRVTGSTLTHIEVLFTQISKNFQAINKSFGVIVTLQDDTNKVSKEETAALVIVQQRLTVNKIQPISFEDEEFSLLDLFNPLDLLDHFDRTSKKEKERKAKREKERKAREDARKKAEAEQKEFDKNKEKTRAKAEAEAKAAKEKALKEGKSLKDAEKAAAKAAKKVVKIASEEAVEKVARRLVLAKIAKAAWKMVPIVGTAVGLYWAVERFVAGDRTGAVFEAAGGLAGPISSTAAALPDMAAAAYFEMYGVDFGEDLINDPQGATERMNLIRKVVQKILIEELSKKAEKHADFKAKARALKTDPKNISKQEARNVLDAGLSDKQLNDQFEGGRKALEEKAGVKIVQQTAAPTPSVARVEQPTAPAGPGTQEAFGAYGMVKVGFRPAPAPVVPAFTPTPVFANRIATEDQKKEAAKLITPTAKEEDKFEEGKSTVGAVTDQKAWVSSLWNPGLKAARSMDVPPLGLLGQWALESSWGSKLTGDYNYFGIKSFGKGPQRLVETTEQKLSKEQIDWYQKKGWFIKDLGGGKVRVKDLFKSFSSPADAVVGYEKFLRQNDRYKKVFGTKTLEQFGAALKAAGYATAENYAKQIAEMGDSVKRRLSEQQIAMIDEPSSGTQLASASTQVAGIKKDQKIDQAKNLNVIAINETNSRSVPA